MDSLPLSVRIIQTRIDRRDDGRSVLELLTRRFTYRDEAGWRERIAAGELFLDGVPARADDILRDGMTLEYRPTDIVEPEVDPHYSIVYEDAHFLVADKSGDLPVHPAGVFYKNTLWYLLTERYGAIHPVNRLDRETSGLVLIARDPETAAKLAATPMHKRYCALVFGEFTEPVDAEGCLVRDPASPVRRKRKFLLHGAAGEHCRTLLTPGGAAGPYSLVYAELETGRMHQIRATLCSLGFPLVGDKLYGPDETLFVKRAKTGSLSEDDYARLGMRRQALHAMELSFRHPVTGEELTLTSPLPEDMKRVWEDKISEKTYRGP